MANLENEVRGVQDQATELAGRAKQADEQQQRLTGLVEQGEKRQTSLAEVATVLASMEGAWRRGFEQALTAMVSRGLTLVLGEPTTFTIESKPRGGAPALAFKLEQNGLETDILEAKGGTVVQLTSFLLRLAIVLAAQPPLRKVLVLDEAFSHVSMEYVPALADLLRQLCDETGVQLIIVTHEPAFIDAADIAYEVSQKKGISHYERVKDKRDD